MSEDGERERKRERKPTVFILVIEGKQRNKEKNSEQADV